jgi:hypothetical protein
MSGMVIWVLLPWLFWAFMVFCIYRLVTLGKSWVGSRSAVAPQSDVDISKAGYYDICLSRNIVKQSASWPQTDFVITHAGNRESSPFYKETYPNIKMKSGRMTGSSGYFFAPVPGKYLIANPHTSGFLQDDAILIRKRVSPGERALWIGAVVGSVLLFILSNILPGYILYIF